MNFVKKFYFGARLKIHEKIHTSEKPYPSNACNLNLVHHIPKSFKKELTQMNNPMSVAYAAQNLGP